MLATIGWLARLDYAQKISTNVLDLIPADERSPEASLVRNLAGDEQARVMLFALRDPANPAVPPLETARQFAAELARAPAFAEALSLADSSSRKALGQAIFERRFKLLLPSWLGRRQQEFARTGQPAAQFSAWLSEHSAAELEIFLGQPEAMPMQDLVMSDPLLLVPGLVKRVYGLASSGSGTNGGTALVWARIKTSPFGEAGQQPVFTAIDAALARIKADRPGTEMRWTGINRFAAASRARIESEFTALNTISILAVLAVGCLLVRRIYQMVHLVPVILLSLLGAWTVSTMVFDHIHILVFVVGSLLSGVAIDYGFYIYMQPALRPGEPYAEKLRRLVKPLLASCLTTVLGFSLLLFSDLPMLREVGVFVGAGLLCALAAAMLYFAQLEQPFLETRRFGRTNGGETSRISPGWVRGALVGAVLIALLGPWRLHWRDDIRDLEIPSPELKANDAALRELFGDSEERTIFLTHGATVAEARQHLAAFLVHEAKIVPQGNTASLGLVFPTAEDWQALASRLNALPHFAGDFREALARHGFTPSAFAGFFAEWEKLQANPPAGDYAALYADLRPHLTGPLALLYRAEEPMSWFLTIVEGNRAPVVPPDLHTIAVSQLESLNGLFTRYRWSALRLSLIGLGLVIASVFAIYRGRTGVRIALIPAGSCFFVFGMLGLFGQTLNLFHLLGAFLGVCLSHNYAIFSAETARDGLAPPTAIRLSALSAAASFGVLGFSHIPVIHALGTTVALIVLTALAVVELEPRARCNAARARGAR